MEYISAGSSSSGNCYFIKEGSTKILVDAGLSGKAVDSALSMHDEDLKGALGILITHEHNDHIKGAGILSRKYNLPIIGSLGTIKALEGKIGNVKENNLVIIDKNSPFSIGDLEITAFPISHDAADPVMYKISGRDSNLAVITDIGEVDEGVKNIIRGVDTCILESNHDRNMLEVGPYTYELKQRVASVYGHLSNDDAGHLAAYLVQTGTKNIHLAHLSQKNNIPILAYQSVVTILAEQGIKAGRDLVLTVLEACAPSKKIAV